MEKFVGSGQPQSTGNLERPIQEHRISRRHQPRTSDNGHGAAERFSLPIGNDQIDQSSPTTATTLT
jgi:hypothetical protein